MNYSLELTYLSSEIFVLLVIFTFISGSVKYESMKRSVQQCEFVAALWWNDWLITKLFVLVIIILSIYYEEPFVIYGCRGK